MSTFSIPDRYSNPVFESIVNKFWYLKRKLLQFSGGQNVPAYSCCRLPKLRRALGKYFHVTLGNFLLIHLIMFTYDKPCFLTVGSALLILINESVNGQPAESDYANLD